MTDPELPTTDLPAEAPDDLVVAIEALPDGEAADAIMALARQPGRATVPALQTLATSGRAAVAEAALSALGRIATPEAASALAILGEQGGNKEQRKLARRLLHRLAAAGVRAVRAEAASARPLSLRSDYRPHRGLASAIDGEGTRIVHTAFIEAAGGIVLLSALVSDERGIVDFADRRLGRRRFAEEYQELLRREWPIFVEVPAEYGRFLLYEGLTRAQSARLPVPVEVMPWYDVITAGQPTHQRALIYEHLDAAEVRWNPAYLDESPALLELPEMESWRLDPDTVAPFDPEEEAQRARVILPEHTRREQSASAVERAVAALFEGPARERWRRRLEEMAYIFLRRGSERNARRALAAAIALEETAGTTILGGPSTVHPFLAALVTQAFAMRRQAAGEQLVRQGGLWLPRATE